MSNASPMSAEPTNEQDPSGSNSEEGTMTIWEHLEELRSRIIRMIIAALAGGAGAWIYREDVLKWLVKPFQEAGGIDLNFQSPAAMFISYVRIAAMAGFIFALPIILYQVWAFIAPGLYSREKKFAIPFVLSSCGLFALGGWFGWRFAFPLAFKYLLSFAGTVGGIQIKATVMVSEYLDFVSRMLLAFGFAAELPVLVFFLAIAGLVDHKSLIKFFRYFVVIAFVISAILTPPDPLSQLMLALPLCLLYGISILVAYIFSKRKKDSADS
ncbi:MAG TPA: twin-arginine translocase subunit TatC [Polyangiaceae bacterium]|nr:twin-arginine translocase subunit TatC [Polyangiaceae bacterium]